MKALSKVIKSMRVFFIECRPTRSQYQGLREDQIKELIYQQFYNTF